jgi:hypothetical protein
LDDNSGGFHTDENGSKTQKTTTKGFLLYTNQGDEGLKANNPSYKPVLKRGVMQITKVLISANYSKSGAAPFIMNKANSR